MPFVQRIVQPTHLARVRPSIENVHIENPSDKYRNNNCVKKRQFQDVESEEIAETAPPSPLTAAVVATAKPSRDITHAVVHSSPDNEHLRDVRRVVAATEHSSFEKKFVTRVDDETDHPRASALNAGDREAIGKRLAVAEDDLRANPDPEAKLNLKQLQAAHQPVLSMKKLKQHVDFLSTAPSPIRSSNRQYGTGASIIASRPTLGVNNSVDAVNRRRPKSPTAAKIIAGYEFDSISNLTLSNALRQLASLVLIASDIFDDLQCELQNVNERASAVQRKIVTVEQRVCAYDPKKITVPESDLLTFSQRKCNYETNRVLHDKLFTVTTRPYSIRVLYEDAGIELPPSVVYRGGATTGSSPLSAASYALNEGQDIDNINDASNAMECISTEQDDFLSMNLFGNTTRKMQTRIDTEIEIRLPAAIDDLRKWTSSEALGDVTVTPDCIHHVDTSICTTVIPGDLVTPDYSPSVLTPDAIDAVYSINISNVSDNITTTIPNSIDNGVPLNHRLPSPEEQCKTIALRYPAEVISVDTSGKGFERMCMARKSTISCFIANSANDTNNATDDIQPASRHSRSRKARGKRRNTIAGFDQKEIQDAAKEHLAATSSGGVHKSAVSTSLTRAEDAERADRKSKKIGRSKSNDILKKDSVALPYDKGKNTLTRLNSLKLWGRNRFKFMSSGSNNNNTNANKENTFDVSNATMNSPWTDGIESEARRGHEQITVTKDSRVLTAGQNGVEIGIAVDDETINNNKIGSAKCKSINIDSDVDDNGRMLMHLLMPPPRSEGRFSHERKPSYSSSEKSMGASSSGQMRGKLHLATCGNVKMRDTSSLNRQRRNGITIFGLGKDDQPNSSSGNWSASSESGRASIGSETTIQPKSSASNTSLNVSSFHPGSGPPSSMMSRRRFLNTSASSSMTSEGTATPDLQMVENAYPNHLDDETSSSYSCDTEGYYTSFHMDSGLRTLKEEEPVLGALQLGQIMPGMNAGNTFNGINSNLSTLTAENEYELFGRGSTSTTASSAGTVCTTLMLNGTIGAHNSSNSIGPDVPERISSLGKLNERSHSNSTSTLERSYSSSTIASSLECTGTIKRNANTSLKLSNAESDDIDIGTTTTDDNSTIVGNHHHHRSPLRPLSGIVAGITEMEYSESSDLEGVERIERIKQKTALNAKRIPSMCIITPTTSDDENQSKDTIEGEETFDPNRTLTNESSPCSKAAAKAKMQLGSSNNQDADAYSTLDVVNISPKAARSLEKSNVNFGKDHNLNTLTKGNSLSSTNNMSGIVSLAGCTSATIEQDALYDMTGEYVTIADISNNNKHNQLPSPIFKSNSGIGNLGIYYSNDVMKRKQSSDANPSLSTVKLSNSTTTATTRASHRRETEYVSLNELPTTLRPDVNNAGATGGYERLVSDCAYSANKEMMPLRGSMSAKMTTVPMYAEISEVQEEKALLLSSTVAKQQSSGPALPPQNKGAPVRVNAQGKIIYDSDSLKRRKGAHTTFAPGPYVKETESALADVALKCGSDSESVSLQSEALNVKSIVGGPTNNRINAAAAKLLLLKGGGLAIKRKGTSVINNQQEESALTSSTSKSKSKSKFNMFQRAKIPTPLAPYLDKHLHGPATITIGSEDGQNGSTGIVDRNATTTTATATAMMMMHSPSAKSTASTSSTVSSSAASTSRSCSASPIGGGYQRLASTNGDSPSSLQQHNNGPMHITQQSEVQKSTELNNDSLIFQRDTPIYWTLQNRRQSKLAVSSASCRDDLYAKPIRRSERGQNGLSSAMAGSQQRNISPIVPRNINGFLTSTPTKEDDFPERYNTCSDRIGLTKTSLLDFKKLLLAKSTKSSPVHKVSAVEMLKKPSDGTSSNMPIRPTVGSNNLTTKPLNSSMQLLDLSGSPKTFANRRMLRQGQFGSPSKAFAPKVKVPSNPAGAAVLRSTGSVKHTDVMSTIILEASSEDDHSNASGSRSSRASSSDDTGSDVNATEKTLQCCSDSSSADAEIDISQANFNRKRNFFLQTEENNFIRGELKPSFLTKSTFVDVKSTSSSPIKKSNECNSSSEDKSTAGNQQALETAL